MDNEEDTAHSDPYGSGRPPDETERPVPVLAIILGLACALIGAPFGMQMGLDAGEHPPIFSLCFGFLLGGLGGAAAGAFINRITQFPPKPSWEFTKDKRYRRTIIIVAIILVAVVLAWVLYF